MTITSLAVLRMPEKIMLLISEIEEGPELTGRAEDDVSAVSAMAAVGAAAWNVLLPSESDAAVAAVPGLDEYFNLIDEHRNRAGSGWMESGGPAGQAGPKQH
jgi:hypothetical protein